MKKAFIYFKQIILHPYGKSHFLLTHASKPGVRILDVGCGNNSVRHIKRCCQECYYIGIDVGNYNLDRDSQSKMDEYYVVTPEEFGDKIRELQDSIDIVISSHNIEHCNEPYKVLKNMALSLKMGGAIYLSFPSEDSVHFPNRKGTLNFYDDTTHSWLPKWGEIIHILEENDMRIEYACKNYSPLWERMIGKLNERKSKQMKKVLKGTWAYYGFESIIWGVKMK